MNRREFLKTFTISSAALGIALNEVSAQVFTNPGPGSSITNHQDTNVKTYTNPGLPDANYSQAKSPISERERFIVMQTQQEVQTLLWVRREKDEYQLDYMGDKGSKMIAWLLRDVKANRQGVPDIRLLHTLSWIQTWLALHGHHACIDILSGMRMPSTNAALEGAAQGSWHQPNASGVFRAVDMRIKSISSIYVGKLAYLMHQGGVGFYDRDFIHVDTGNLFGKHGTQRVWRHK